MLGGEGAYSVRTEESPSWFKAKLLSGIQKAVTTPGERELVGVVVGRFLLSQGELISLVVRPPWCLVKKNPEISVFRCRRL